MKARLSFPLSVVVAFLQGVPKVALSVEPGSAGDPNQRTKGFFPHAGYKRTVQVQNIKRNFVARGILAPAAPQRATWGERRLPAILVAFANRPGPFPPADYQRLLFATVEGAAGPPATLRQYYRDVSNGNLDVNGEVVPWFTLPRDDTYYEGTENGWGRPFGELLKLALDNADQNLDFGRFDNDGPDGLPNSGDDDGTVDTVLFIHPEAGAELNRQFPSVARNIWSHSWHYSEPAYGHSERYRTRDIRRDEDGNPVIGANGEPATILIDDYTIQPGIARPADPGEPLEIVHIGVISHEYGHALGLPDLYDRTPDGTPDSSGIGSWCLMASGSYGGDGVHSDRPCHMGAWAKWYLGWANPLPLVSSMQLIFEPVQEQNQIYRYDVPGTAEREYFLIEFRDKTWDKPGHINWDENVFTSGLAIWHVDENVGKQGANGQENEQWPFAAPDEGQNDAPSRSGSDRHALVALIQSDRLFDLEHNRDRGDDTDLWGLPNQVFGDDPILGARSYDGRFSGLTIRDIHTGPRTAFVEVASSHPPEEAIASSRAPAAAAPRAAELPMTERRKLCPTVSEKKGDDCKEVERIKAKLPATCRDSIPEEDAKKLAKFDRCDIKQVVSGSQRKTFLASAAKQRQSEVRPQAEPKDDAQRATVDVLRRARQDTPVEIQSDPSGKFVERVTKLNIPIQDKTSLVKDAEKRVAAELRPLFPDVQLRSTEQSNRRPDTVRFQQMIEVDGEKLPVFGKYAELHYNQVKGILTAVTAELTQPEKVQITGKGELTPAEAGEIVSRYLGVSSASETYKAQSERGVFLVGDDPAKARVVTKVRVPAGPGQTEIRVYLDAETKQVLEVK